MTMNLHNQQNVADPPVRGARQVSGVESDSVPSRAVR